MPRFDAIAKHVLWTINVVALSFGVSNSARAATDCQFELTGDQMRLLGSCTTDETLFVGDGMTLDGDGYVITAVDPPTGAFQGAVIQNAGQEMHIRDVALDSAGLAPSCHSSDPDLRLHAILFLEAGGSVVDSEIANISQASGGCQEGDAIEVRAGAGPVELRIVGNTIYGYQKTGIGLFGGVDAHIAFNHIEGYGPTDRLAQNGVQVAQGARATIRWNRIVQHVYAPQTAASTGVVLWEAAAGSKVTLNALRDNDVGVYLLDTSGARVAFNRIADATFTSIYEDGAGEDNVVLFNRCTSGGAPVDCAP